MDTAEPKKRDTAKDYEALINIIKNIKDDDIAQLTKMPFDNYMQEAENLYIACQKYKDILSEIKIDWVLVESVPQRTGALAEATARFLARLFEKQEYEKEWNVKSKEIYDLWRFLLRTFRFAYRANERVQERISVIVGSRSNDALIQDLNNFAVLGENNAKELEAINFDMQLLYKADQLSRDGKRLIALMKNEKDYISARKIRDQAYTYLKQAVDEICAFGQYAFWDDDEKRKAFASSYLRRNRKKAAKPEEGTAGQVTT